MHRAARTLVRPSPLRISLGLAGVLGGLVIVAAPPTVQAETRVAPATTAVTSTPASTARKLDREVTYAHYPTKAACHAQGELLTAAKLAKAYKCIPYQLRVLID